MGKPYHTSGCMVCGKELIANANTEEISCYYCGQPFKSSVYCTDRHYVCDICHSSTGLEIMRRVCAGSTETDATALMQAIRSHPSFPMHGPEHHSLVPAVILTALRNNGYNISQQQIDTAIERGKTVIGGACGFMGACGTGVGAGIALSILMESNPYHAEKRQKVMQATSRVLDEIGKYTAARCCQRDSWIALSAIANIIREELGIALPVGKIECQQFAKNKECIYHQCPLWGDNALPERHDFETWSVCPQCLKRIPARRVKVGKEVFLRKECPQHGAFETIIWRGHYDMDEWIGAHNIPFTSEPPCPDECGLCAEHLQQTCCVLLNVTDNCNLGCSFCLANQHNGTADPSLGTIRGWLSDAIVKGKTLVQLSGGEPTTRNDLPAIVRMAKELGAKYVQLNTNGIRLAEDVDYVRELADAGLSFVFMQFDGTNDDIHQALRGRPLLELKQRAIEHCARFNLGVTLVPTLVRGVNIDNIGEIVRFAVGQSPWVRGIHFQPVSYFGRMPQLPTNSERFTLDELVYEIDRQTHGSVSANSLLPSCCDHPLCGFHGDFVVDYQGGLYPLSKREHASACCCDPAAAEKNREFVARRWLRHDQTTNAAGEQEGNLQDMEHFLNRVKSHGFTITSMAFQDAGNIDFARLRQCSFHVYDRGKLVPFCAHYLTQW